ncbi:hypothetical protein B0H14DRAFT_2725958 [Mycena olivaceomarginata]|nr:hypothetical protein B0H14DRAFT_2725958 [Mycena olivaceomarginata]
MFVLLTFSRLLISSLCVLFPHCPCLSCSLFLAFLSLAGVKCMLFPPSPMFLLLTFSCPLVSSDLTHFHFHLLSLSRFPTNRFGMRAFFKHGTAVNHSLFQGQG